MPEDALQTGRLSPEGSAETLIEIEGVGKTFTGQDGEQIVALEGIKQPDFKWCNNPTCSRQKTCGTK